MNKLAKTKRKILVLGFLNRNKSYLCASKADLYAMEDNCGNLIDLRQVFEAKAPKLMKRMPGFVFRRVQKLLHEDDINRILSQYGHLQGVDFVQAVIKDFNLNVLVRGADHLSASPRVLVASNHPLGGLDGIALIGTVGETYRNVVTPVNDFLMFVKNLQPIFIPVNKVGKGVTNREENLRLFNETFASDRAICYFPFGLCSRKVKGGKIMDLDWKKTFLSKAKEYHRDILPVHIDGHNTKFFYNLARLRKQLRIKVNIEMAFLVDEFFKQRDKTLSITFGKPIPYLTFDSRHTDAEWAERLRRFSYNLANDPDLVFNPEADYQIP